MKITRYLLIFLIAIMGCHSQNAMSGEDSKVTTLVEESFIYLNGPYVNLPDSISRSVLTTIITSKEILGGDAPFASRNIFGYRTGKIQNGKQEGKWETYKFHEYDSLGYSRSKRYLGREEYFKNGLRDGIYKIYNKNGKIVYSAYFEKGNGVEKDFYDDGQLYYQIKTKDGYFTDTLKLYKKNGQLMQNLLYKKDSLIFKKDYQ